MKLTGLALACAIAPGSCLTGGQEDSRNIASAIFKVYYAVENLNNQYRLFSSSEQIDSEVLNYNNFVLYSQLAQASSAAGFEATKLPSTDVLVVQNALTSLGSAITVSASNVIAKRGLFSSASIEERVNYWAGLQVAAGSSMYSAIKSKLSAQQTALVTSDAKIYYAKYSSVISAFPTNGP